MRDRLRTTFHRTPEAAGIMPGDYALNSSFSELAAALGTICGAIGPGMVKKDYPSPDLKLDFDKGPLPYNPWPNFRHLGMFLRAERRSDGSLAHVVLPKPETVLRVIENGRIASYGDLRGFLGSPENFVAALGSGRSAEFRDINAVEQVIVGQIYAYDLMRLFLRCHYKLLPDPDKGWKRGVKVEMELLESKLKPRGQWAPFARQAVDDFFIAIDDDEEVGGFATPTPGGGGGGGGGPGPGPPPDRRPERLLFYMSLPQFLEFRYLHKKNRYEYCVAIFTEDRVIVDTALNDNCLFGLEGPLVECMKVSPDFKDSVRNSPLCTLDKRHDPAGAWKGHVQRWLSGNADA